MNLGQIIYIKQVNPCLEKLARGHRHLNTNNAHQNDTLFITDMIKKITFQVMINVA